MPHPLRTIILLHVAVSFSIVAVIGHGFVSLQYTFFWFSAEAGLPANATGPGPCEYDNSSARPDDVAKLEWVQKRSAQVSTVCSLITGSFGLLTTVLLGQLSDRKGRKPAVMVNFLGSFLSIIIFSLMVILKLPPWILYLASLPSGLTGNGLTGLFLLAFTMISDVTVGCSGKSTTSVDRVLSQSDSVSSENSTECYSESDRVYVETLQTRPELNTDRRRLILMGVFDGVTGCIFALTQYFAGKVIQEIGFVVPVGIILGSEVLGLICLLCMPETRVVTTKAANLSVHLASSSDPEVIPPHTSPRFRSAAFLWNPTVLLGFLITFFSALVLWTDAGVCMLYLMGKPFCWKSDQLGLYMGLRSGSSAVVTAIIFVAMGLSANCCFNEPGEGQAALEYQTTSSEVQNEAPSQSSPLLSHGLSPASRRYKRRLIIAIASTLALLALSRLIFGTAWMVPFPLHSYLVFLALLLGTIAFYLPLLNSLISDAVKPEEHGRLFSVMGFATVLGMLIGMTAQPMIYSATTEHCPGAVFIFDSLILFLTTALATGLACVRSQWYA
ncbi:hypothetical protein SprV_0100384100 [Sparganum proliferum]